MSYLRIAVLALSVLSLALPPALARADEVKVQVQDKRDEYSYEYEDAYCKFKYKLKYKDGEEEVDREGDCPPRGALPRFDPPVGGHGFAGVGRGRLGDFRDPGLAGSVAGAVAGGAIGSELAGGDDRAVGLVIGGLLGSVLGSEVGRRIDAEDRRSFGRALDQTEPGGRVRWTNPESDLRYDLRGFSALDERYGVPCRRFEMRVRGGRWREAEACQRGDGAWQIVELR